MRYGLICMLVLCLPMHHAFGQADSIDFNIKDVKYEPVTEDYFADYKDAKLIMNYYCSEGWSINDRYTYEVVLIDSLLMLGFYSPETESLRYISYEKKIYISSAMVDTMKNILGVAGLKQVKEGVPKPTAAANTKEVLIVKYGNLNITGGMFFYNTLQGDASNDKINAMVARERNLTSSIGGDYDIVIKAMVKLFPELNSLRTQVIKYK